jgi:Fe-S-cluster containining protein
MQLIDNILISDKTWNTRFTCDTNRCLGKCCQYGDLGSPVSKDEVKIIEKNLENIFPFLSTQNRMFLKNGVAELWQDSLHLREIGQNIPCPLSYKSENGQILCSLHSYALHNNLDVYKIKPLWCSMFPLMIQKSLEGWIINVEIADFCVAKKNSLPILLSFEPLLTSLFGSEWIKKVKTRYREQGLKLKK